MRLRGTRCRHRKGGNLNRRGLFRLRRFGELRRVGSRPWRDTLRARRRKPVIEGKRRIRAPRRERGNQRRRCRSRRDYLVRGRKRGSRQGRCPSGNRGFIADAAERRINIRGQNIGVDRPGAAQHNAGNCHAAEKLLRAGFPGCTLWLGRRELETRTRTNTHSPHQTDPAFSPCRRRSKARNPAAHPNADLRTRMCRNFGRFLANRQSVIKASFS